LEEYLLEMAGIADKIAFGNLTVKINSRSEKDELGNSFAKMIVSLRNSVSQLTESEEKFRSLFEKHSSIMLLIDPESCIIIEGNPAASQFYGYSQAELRSMNLANIIALPTEDLSVELMNAAQRKNNNFVTTNRLANGEIRMVKVDSSPILVQGKIFLFSIIRDITDQKKAEADLIEAQKMASLGTLAAGIAHEINTPLQVITGISESLEKDLQADGKLEGERHARNLNTINRNAWRVAEIVRSLQHYAYPTHDKTEEADLNELLKDTLILMEHQLKTWSNIEIHSNLTQNLPPFVCDRNKIIQVMINLLANARDAMPNGGSISITTSYQPQREMLRLEITDSGKGMSEEVCTRIFDPFFTTKPVGKGTGLGLSIVQGIIRSHGGEIQVESTNGKGTTFIITLPLIGPACKPVTDSDDSSMVKLQSRYDDF
jgi:PAS domain S-box-containing protein